MYTCTYTRIVIIWVVGESAGDYMLKCVVACAGIQAFACLHINAREKQDRDA